MKRTVFTLLLVVIAALAVALAWLYRDTRPAVEMARDARLLTVDGAGEAETVVIERTVVQDPVRPPKVPEMIVFAGDTIRFDRMDLYERMERELTAFTYSHTNSLLMLKRSGRIFPQIEPLLAANGVPDDLKYLMAIESNVSETAVSVAGAGGLWQFMRDVGREYGLEVSATVDERFHVRKETEAACAYLKKAYARFGDWMTVAASFNGGINGITKKREVQHQAHAMDMFLVEETSRYMFRILVAKMMFEDPAQFGFRLDQSEYYPYFPPERIVAVSSPIDDLAEFAARYGLTYAQLRRANPWLRDTKLTPARGRVYEIEIPNVVAERAWILDTLSE